MYRADIIRAKQASLNLTTQELSERCGVSRNRVGLYRKGKVTNVNLTSLKRIADALNIELHELFTTEQPTEQRAA